MSICEWEAWKEKNLRYIFFNLNTSVNCAKRNVRKRMCVRACMWEREGEKKHVYVCMEFHVLKCVGGTTVGACCVRAAMEK